MQTAMVQEQARAQLKAALLGLLAAFQEHEAASPQYVVVEFGFTDAWQEGEYSFFFNHKGTDVPMQGGSL